MGMGHIVTHVCVYVCECECDTGVTCVEPSLPSGPAV